MRKLNIGFLLVLALCTVSCFKDNNFEPGDWDTSSHSQPGRLPTEEVRNVMIMYSAGYNDLSGSLIQDLEELDYGFVPGASSRADNILLVFTRQKYYDSSAPFLYRLYKDKEGTVVKDTLLTWDKTTQATDPAVLKEVMTFARQKFPAKGYGLVYSSHASGWHPAYNSSKASVKSIGQDDDTGRVHETELYEFVDALPYKLDYILFDACFMACVEVAWALKDKATWLGFSPTEIMSDGFHYQTLAERLIGGTEPDPLGVCQDYFAQYQEPGRTSPYATITLVDTRELPQLASVCKTLFEAYRPNINALTSYQVQRYFRMGHNPAYEHLFDLRHMLVKAGISAAETAQLDAALAACIRYEKHTPYFMSLRLENVCGLSVLLPSSADATLKDFYRQHVVWNDETNLIN